jgi:LPXTG-motif cell wall-anchored protein
VFCAATLLVAAVNVVSPVHVLAVTPISQVGADIDGELAGDYSGWSVAMSGDGSRIAVGAIENDGNGSNAGHVRVYTLVNGTWTQTGADIDGEAVADYSGLSVAMSDDGSRVAVGAIYNDGSDGSRISAGHVRVYTLISGAWIQTGLDIDGEVAGDQSGWSVAMSGDGSRIAVGAPYNDGNGSNAGHVRVYTLISGAWTQTGLDIDGEDAGDLSGWSVAMSGDGSRIAVGATGNRSVAGHVRVYTLISGAWTQTGLDIDGEAALDFSGYSVAMSGDGSRIAIGAYLNDGNGSDAGHVRVYTLINGTWTQTGADIDGEALDDVSGVSVAMSGDGSRIAIGASNNDGTYSNAGHVRVYTLINGTWTQTGVDIDGEAADDESGRSVAMSDDGSRIAIGAYSNDGNGIDAGHVRVFGAPTVPVAPTITSVVGTNGSLSVTFASGADGGSPITNYKYSIDGTNYIALNPATTSSPFIISGLTNATTYSVTIKAVNVYGDSLNSNTVSGTPIAPAAIVEPTTTVAVTTTTTVAATTTTTIAAVVILSTKKVTETKNELPKTGSDSFPLFALALGLLSAGLVVTTRKRFARR